MIMENLDSRIKERIKADKKQEIECVKTKILAALETYFSNSQTQQNAILNNNNIDNLIN